MGETSFSKRIRPLLAAQFLGVFNDNAFKMLAVCAGTSVAEAAAKQSGQSSSSYVTISIFMAALTAAYVLPFIMLSGPAGMVSDRFHKRSVMVVGKLAELGVMALCALCLQNAHAWGLMPLAACMFLLTAQAAFFSPAFNGILPESFHEKDLSKANGDVGMASFLAIILGYGAAPLMLALSGGRYWLCGLLLACLSILGLVASMRVESGRIPAAEAKREGSLASIANGFRAICETKPILLSVLGDAFFLAVGSAIQTLIVMLAKFGLERPCGETELGLLLVAPALGIGIGCYLAGRFSGGRIELGLVPFGALGMAVFLPLSGLCHGAPIEIPLLKLFVYPLLVLWLFLCGVSGGLFIIPLRAYFQQRVDEKARGSALASSNALCFIAILVSGAIVLALTAGASAKTGIQAADSLLAMLPNLSPNEMLVILGALTFSVTAYAMWLLPEFALRFVAVTLTHTLYKLRIDGPGSIPERGPALLVSNHVSFVDGLLISCCTSRFVRFLMHEDYYNHPMLNPLARLLGFIEVPSPKRVKSMANMFDDVKSALRAGELVCIFPEGRLTRNGMMDEFKDGYRRMLPEELKVPVIPIRLGMIWGSIFSYYYGKIRIRMPMELPHPATVTIGEPAPQDCTAFELRQIVSQLGAESEMRPRAVERPLHYQLAKNAKRHPFRKAFFDQDGKSLSCFSLLVRSVVLSWEIRRIAKDSQYVGVLLPNCGAAATAFLAVLTADKVPAPLNFSAGRDSIEAAMAKAGIAKVLTSRKFVAKLKMEPAPWMVFLEDVAKEIPAWRKAAAFAMAAILPHQELMNLVSPESHRDVFKTAALLFSSGSSGSPKGVMLSHHNINSDLHSCLRVMGWTSADKIAGTLPLFHSFGLCACFWLPMMIGCEVVYIPNPLDAAAIGEAIEKHKLTLLLATPTFIQSYMKRLKPEQLKSLRLVIVGAEKLRPDIAAKFKEMSGLTLMEGFGCTELSPIVSINLCNSILDLGKLAGRQGSVGSPMPGICAKIVDPSTGAALPPDTEGLMLVRGPNVMQGYVNDPKATAAAIVDGWYNTGDIAKMDVDGRISICGRLSRFSKIGGEMVPHELVESAINEICASEARVAAVCSASDPDKGERLLVLHTELPLSPERIIEELRKRDVPNLWVPKASNFRKAESLPLLGSGKLDLMKLKEMAAKLA